MSKRIMTQIRDMSLAHVVRELGLLTFVFTPTGVLLVYFMFLETFCSFEASCVQCIQI